MPVTDTQLQRIRSTAQDRLRECTRLILFDGNCNILHSTFQVSNLDVHLSMVVFFLRPPPGRGGDEEADQLPPLPMR